MKHRYLGLLAVVLIAASGFRSPVSASPHPKIRGAGIFSSATAGKLLGRWKSQSEWGTINLHFRSDSQLEFEGETFSYTLLPQVIRLRDGNETIDYGYSLQGNTLIIAFPEGYQLQFTRVGPPPSPVHRETNRSPAVSARPNSFQAGGAQAGGGEPARQTASSTIGSGEIGSVHWGFKGKPPSGWKFQQNDRGAVLGHDTIAGMILVIPHLAVSQNEVETNLRQGLVEEGTRLNLTGDLEVIGNGALGGEYQGVYQGQQVRARGIGTFSSTGGGAFIIALTTPEMYGADLTNAAGALAGNLEYFPVDDSELKTHFIGMWAHVTPNTLTNFELYADGTFTSSYEAGYSGKFQNDLGQQTGNWGASGQDRGRGRWVVRGTREQGALILTWPNGEQELVEYQVHRERGRTYWTEYLFDGVLYSKQR